MNDMEKLIFPATLAVIVLFILAVWERVSAERLLRRLDRMLERAIEGCFQEEIFNESRLSALESRLAHWLASSALSRENLEDEKTRIQTLISDVSHQLKTPAANVLLYAQLLSEQVLPTDARACADALESQAGKLCALTDLLSRLSRLEAGILTLNPVPGEISCVLEDAAAQFAPLAEEKGVKLTLEAVGGVTAVFDPKWTAEAVCNLVDNAVKYTPAGGSVTIDAVSYEYFSRINVSDNGPGVPEEERSKIFQRFYRSPGARECEGLGIGLYLARQIAEGQGGYLKVFSPRRGGAVFSMFLPRG